MVFVMIPGCVALLFFSGCVVGPNYTHPPYSPVAKSFPEADLIETPENNRLPEVDPYKLDQLDHWWTQINDPILDRLIQLALSGDLDLKIAAERICEARANRGVVTSGLFPQIDTDASFTHEKLSSGLNSIATTTASTVRDRWTWGTNLNWELDVFGKIERLVEASDASVGESVEYYRDTMVMLTAETGTAYVELRSLQQQIANVEKNIEIQKHSAKIAWALFEKGKTSKLDAVQAEAALMSSEAELPPLYAALRVEVNRLAVLVGMPPGELDDMLLAKQPIPTAPSQIAKVIPAELLRRRQTSGLRNEKLPAKPRSSVPPWQICTHSFRYQVRSV